MRRITPLAIAHVAYEARRMYCRALGESLPPDWEQASRQQRTEVLVGVEAVLSGTANSAARLHDALPKETMTIGPPYEFLASGYDDLCVDQRRKLLLFRAIVLALVDGPCNGLCHDEKCSLVDDHDCHFDTCMSKFGIPPGLLRETPALEAAVLEDGYGPSSRAEKLYC
jgi:hypothetical protein